MNYTVVLEHIRGNIMAEIERVQDNLGHGAAQTHEQYMKQVGYILGLEFSLRELLDTEKQLDAS